MIPQAICKHRCASGGFGGAFLLALKKPRNFGFGEVLSGELISNSRTLFAKTVHARPVIPLGGRFSFLPRFPGPFGTQDPKFAALSVLFPRPPARTRPRGLVPGSRSLERELSESLVNCRQRLTGTVNSIQFLRERRSQPHAVLTSVFTPMRLAPRPNSVRSMQPLKRTDC